MKGATTRVGTGILRVEFYRLLQPLVSLRVVFLAVRPDMRIAALIVIVSLKLIGRSFECTRVLRI